jgi:magnesium chelatase family protein
MMVQRVSTVAFEGIEVRPVDVQVQVAPGMPAFTIVGLPDKAVSEARERVRSALIASGLALPARRITINLAPADLPKEGSHYDLPIALGLMAAIGAIPHDALSGFTVLGELGLDGSISPVAGVLPAAIGANARGEGLMCPAACGPEAAWASPISRSWRRPRSSSSPTTSRARRCCRGRSRKFSRAAAPYSISPTSRARKAPSARSKWRRAAITS